MHSCQLDAAPLLDGPAPAMNHAGILAQQLGDLRGGTVRLPQRDEFFFRDFQ
jgi:hypothetical protein